jgi:dimethylsulfoniopropionate demethylase
LWDLLVDAGEGLNLRSGCPNLIDRIETGLLSYGNDMTLNENPIEAGLDRFFKMGKAADYLGREALERIASAGPDRRIVRLVVKGDAIANPRETYPLTVADTQGGGCVTSITFSPRLGFNVGLGYVPADTTATGTTVTIDTPTGTVTGHIANNDWQTAD